MTTFAERMDAVDQAGILSFRVMKSLQPARPLILGVILAVYHFGFSLCLCVSVVNPLRSGA
jgi:hypothetical protein